MRPLSFSREAAPWHRHIRPRSPQDHYLQRRDARHAETRPPQRRVAPNIGVPRSDPRPDVLAEISTAEAHRPRGGRVHRHPRCAGGLRQTEGHRGEYLNLLQRCDALLLVARPSTIPSVPHVAGTVEPTGTRNMQLELNFPTSLSSNAGRSASPRSCARRDSRNAICSLASSTSSASSAPDWRTRSRFANRSCQSRRDPSWRTSSCSPRNR